MYDYVDGVTPWVNPSYVTIEEGLSAIGSGAFMNDVKLTGITLPSSVTSIGANAFSGCTSLESIVLPEGLMTIEAGAFDGCSALSLTIPMSVETIEGSSIGAAYLYIYEGSTAQTFCDEHEIAYFVLNEPVFSITSGVCGDDLIWTITEMEDGGLLLTVSGIGEMYDYPSGAPWKNSGITEAVIEDGATSVGSHARNLGQSIPTGSLKL